MNETESARPPSTYFAPAGRDTPDAFARKEEIVGRSPLLCEALNTIHDMVLILNEHRQIVAANEAALKTLDVPLADLWKKRPGEAFGCTWSKLGPDGCGTEQHCFTCGAVNAILQSQEKNIRIVKECRIRVDGPSGPSALDLKVAATPITVEGQRFVVLAIEDISQPKRLEVLQRVFFHDVLNTAGCISGYASFLLANRDALEEACSRLMCLSEDLVEEIRAQRDLVLAEAGNLEVDVKMVSSQQVLDELRAAYLRNPIADDHPIVVGNAWSGSIWTDRRLLLRVLGNMLKNGLEATAKGQAVTVACLEQGENVVFTVHNAEAIPAEVQLQMFQRSFSTKGEQGRGIGAYSMKLLGEQYLGGKVAFVSRPQEGTTFSLTLPKKRS